MPWKKNRHDELPAKSGGPSCLLSLFERLSLLYPKAYPREARKRLRRIGMILSAITRLCFYLIFNTMLRCSNPSIMKGSDVA